ncbi:hypothetical protein [Corynebacterium argentoratense]|uniref:hypothetical protein n=1 Tax=Corynebacterium argentoratense TaxID=42817 RepID=UPI0028CFDCCB|nr:hypothetical protein [Corynebacterium argentoratense]
MPTSNPWIRYVDMLAVIERSTSDAIKKKNSAKNERDWSYWEGVKENCRVMGVNVADLAVTTPQPPSAAMVETRTLAGVIDCIDVMIEKALSSREEQAQANMLLGLKNLRTELRNQQAKLLGD